MEGQLPLEGGWRSNGPFNLIRGGVPVYRGVITFGGETPSITRNPTYYSGFNITGILDFSGFDGDLGSFPLPSVMNLAKLVQRTGVCIAQDPGLS